MKKTVTHPDGRQEVVEGTAEEIAEYERKLREGKPPKTRKPVLHGAAVDGIPLSSDEEWLVRRHRAGLLYPIVPVAVPYVAPYQAQPCWYCGVVGCCQTHVWCGTLTGNTIDLPVNGNVAGGTLLINNGDMGASQLLTAPKLTS